MKIAISGKGGAGKSTIAAAISLIYARNGAKVLAIDADPDANLASSLGIPKSLRSEIIPVSQRTALIEERTGAKVRQYGQIFKLNPEVSDIADKCATMHRGVALLVLGAVRKAGAGCACPENVLVRALVNDMVLNRREFLIMDLEAGIEHLGRGTARGVDTMLVVTEPGLRSIESTRRIISMAGEIGIKDVRCIGNKVASVTDEQFIRRELSNAEILDMIPYSEDLKTADREGRAVIDNISTELLDHFSGIADRLISK